jgi:DNA-binding MarR family transcriptional regulator
MKIECIIGKIRYISLQSDKFLKRRIKEENLPILINHIPLFYILPYSGEKIIFNELAKEWEISKSSLSDIINKYEALDIVTKCSCNDDKRTVYIGLTNKAKEIKDKLDEFEAEFLDIMLEDFTKEERSIFEGCIKKSIKNMTKI